MTPEKKKEGCFVLMKWMCVQDMRILITMLSMKSANRGGEHKCNWEWACTFGCIHMFLNWILNCQIEADTVTTNTHWVFSMSRCNLGKRRMTVWCDPSNTSPCQVIPHVGDRKEAMESVKTTGHSAVFKVFCMAQQLLSALREATEKQWHPTKG